MGNVKDITGQTINNWYVIKEAGRSKSGTARFLCRCLLCGNERLVEGRSIRSGVSKGCGCYHPKRMETTRHDERLYGVWGGMRDRCNNPNSPQYKWYGGRGIRICPEWDDYSNFRSWAYSHGYDDSAKKYQCTIDRIDTNGNYSPDNCAWRTQKQQCNNTRSNHLLTHNNETHTIQEWSEITGIRKDTIRRRIAVYGWSVDRALSEKTHNHNRRGQVE